MNAITKITQPTLHQLAAQWLQAKAAESAAIAARRALDAQIAKWADDGKIEGSETIKLDRFKISITRKLTRAVDTDKLMAAYENGLSEGARKCFKWSADLQTKEFRIAETNPELLAEVQQFLTTKPATPTIKVEER